MLQKLQLEISSNYSSIINDQFSNSLINSFPLFINQSILKLNKLNTYKINYNGNKKTNSILIQNLYKI